MEHTLRSPPTIRRRSSHFAFRKNDSSSSSLSNLSYPQIPSRRSSLSLCAGYDSNSSALATSTRTPSLNDSLCNIQVVKIRQANAAKSRDTQKSKCLDASEDPFLDCTPRRRALPRELMTRSGYQLAPQLLVRWSSGSYASLGTSSELNSSLESNKMGQLTNPMSQQDSRVGSGHSSHPSTESDMMCPLELPVTFAKIRSYAGIPCIGADNLMSVWTSVNVIADVNPIPLPESSKLAPLDLVILLDSLKQPFVSDLTPMVVATSILISNLVANNDRLAIACVDGSTKKKFELLLPLGFHSFESTRAALDAFSLGQLKKKRKPSPDVSHSIRRVSRLFCPSPRAAFGHLVFVSANPHPVNTLIISGIDRAIGFNTISPHPRFPLETTSHPLGWHIFYDENADDAQAGGSHFMSKVSKVVRQLRTGISAGFISNLDLCFQLGPGCTFESALECTQLQRLRPGETWILKTKVGIPIDFYEKPHLTEHPIIRDLVSQINEIIRMYSSQPIAQHILSVNLKYQHSLLPAPHEVSLETHCTVPRPVNVGLQSPSEDEKAALMGYEDDDGISAGLGSASDGS
ncbi:hypothetical protein N7452_000647 [Penicillium brevicompactum]|uniref:Uncharacterized protein n=1 Tax=Penicillium brevicompactum TaxID=5074 RepID=A0A9W9R6E0_PENBR|nr:hypothetical protein N7452_000647 [Penicillium brevicompactum]